MIFKIPTNNLEAMGVSCAPNLAKQSASSLAGPSECPNMQKANKSSLMTVEIALQSVDSFQIGNLVIGYQKNVPNSRDNRQPY